MPARLQVRDATVLLAMLPFIAFIACGSDSKPLPPNSPTPSPGTVTANVYILPGATAMGPDAFGDHPVVIDKGERMRWRNFDDAPHALVADTAGVPDFHETDVLAPGAEQSFIMTRTGSTPFHCRIHPTMVGTLIVQER